MKTVLGKIVRRRLQTEALLKAWPVPSLAITLVLGFVIAAVAWALEPGRSPRAAACVIGIAAFGGMFLIAAIGVAIFMARRPQQIVEELLRESAMTSRSHWKMALLAEAERYIATTSLKPQRPELVDAWHERWRTQYEVARSASE